MEAFRYQPGDTPVLLCMPHIGTAIPPDIAATMTPAALATPDTDWHLDRLYHFAPALGIGFLTGHWSRYVIDLNRDPTGEVLYPGLDNTELVPLTTFDRDPIYRDGHVPDAAEVARRQDLYWRPYHQQLDSEVAALLDRFGVAVVFVVHSIRSEVPRFFPGRLVDFNLATVDDRSASPQLAGRLTNVLHSLGRYTAQLNGRFKGGYIVRNYGIPQDNVHAVQLQLAKSVYMDEDPPCTYRPHLAALVRPALERTLGTVVDWAWSRARRSRSRAGYL